MDIEARRYQKVGGDGNVVLEKNGKSELDRKEDKRGSIEDCRGRQKTCQHNCYQEKKWIGHILQGEGLMKDVLEGRMEGRRPTGRKRIGMLEELKEESFMIMKRRAKNGKAWRDGWGFVLAR